MKTAIVYVSMHHKNTKKLVDVISSKFDITVIDGFKEKDYDLAKYDLIGFASGIAFGNFYPQILEIMIEKFLENKSIFFIYTYGIKTHIYTTIASRIAKFKKAKVVGKFGCRGYDTYGFLRYIGGIAKKHPNKKDLDKVIKFYEDLTSHK